LDFYWLSGIQKRGIDRLQYSASNSRNVYAVNLSNQTELSLENKQKKSNTINQSNQLASIGYHKTVNWKLFTEYCAVFVKVAGLI
jgi:hypothetical protein